MAFWGSTFIFDNIPSDIYNLYISSPDGGEVNTNGNNDVELYTQSIYRRPVPYLYGVSQSQVLEFDVNITSPNEITAIDAQIIQRWLFGHNRYKKLQIVQNDLEGVYFNCFLKSPQILRVGNLIVGFSAKVVCDSPFAWNFTKTFTASFDEDEPTNLLTINNISDNNYYTYPLVSFTLGTNNSTITIKNTDDNNHQAVFQQLLAGETITLDNDRNIISSSTGLYRLSLFNKKWIRLVQGLNHFEINGFLSGMTFSYSPARKIG